MSLQGGAAIEDNEPDDPAGDETPIDEYDGPLEALDEVQTFLSRDHRSEEIRAAAESLRKGWPPVETAMLDATPMVEAMQRMMDTSGVREALRRMMDTSGVLEVFASRQQAADAAAAMLDSSPMAEFAERFKADLETRIGLNRISEALSEVVRAPTVAEAYDLLNEMEPDLDTVLSAVHVETEAQSDPGALTREPSEQLTVRDKLLILLAILPMLLTVLLYINESQAAERRHTEMLEQQAEQTEQTAELVQEFANLHETVMEVLDLVDNADE